MFTHIHVHTHTLPYCVRGIICLIGCSFLNTEKGQESRRSFFISSIMNLEISIWKIHNLSFTEAAEVSTSCKSKHLLRATAGLITKTKLKEQTSDRMYYICFNLKSFFLLWKFKDSKSSEIHRRWLKMKFLWISFNFTYLKPKTFLCIFLNTQTWELLQPETDKHMHMS